MLILHVLGGLGNQLYQYALYEKLRALGKDVCLDVDDYTVHAREPEKRAFALACFPGVSLRFAKRGERRKYKDDGRDLVSGIRRRLRRIGLLPETGRIVAETEEYQEEIFSLSDGYLDGFWQNEAYFSDILPQLREKLAFPEPEDRINAYYRDKLLSEASVGVHIRRTDYLDASHQSRYAGICTEAYYEAAMQTALSFCSMPSAPAAEKKKNREYSAGRTEGKRETPHIYIFTDDPAYALRRLREGISWLTGAYEEAASELSEIPAGKLPVTVCDWNYGEASFYDMLLMSCCKVMICANSSFSMWGARLCGRKDKLMIRPLYQDIEQRESYRRIRQDWKDWVLIDDAGNNA